jgi:hypothetical protein
MSAERPLWTCPKCGVKLVTRNLAHSCGRATLEDWLARVGPPGRALYDRFTALIGDCGEFHVSPALSRIAFLARIRFAGITKLTDERMDCGFSLPEPLPSSRFTSVREVVPGWWVHQLRITDPDQLDDQVADWLCQSYHLMGMQERWKGMRGGRRASE